MADLQQALDAAGADPRSPAWDLIWQQSCDQGTCDPASAVLLPWLARTCTAFPPADRDRALILAGFIAVDADTGSRATYADDIAVLRALTLGGLAIDAYPDPTFVYLLQATLGFDGDEIWGKELDRVNDGEADVRCPECEAEMLVTLSVDDATIAPGLPSELSRRLHAAAVRANRSSVATAITLLFGRVGCDECGASFVLADQLAGSAA